MIKYKPRDYQTAAATAAVRHLLYGRGGGLVVIATGGGKSIVISEIAKRLDAPVLVFCPSKEILEQNYSKARSYGIDCGMYSASVGRRDIKPVTFCMIGSVRRWAELFQGFGYIIVDEAHKVNPKEGMYKRFFAEVKRPIVGLTATPYRLETIADMDYKTRRVKSAKSYLQCITFYPKREKGQWVNASVFPKLVYNIETRDLFRRGYLAEPHYYECFPQGFNASRLQHNSTGADYTDTSVLAEYARTDFSGHLASVVQRLLDAGRNGILVFTRFVEDAEKLAKAIKGCEYVCGATPKKEREDILARFKSGKTKVVANAACLIEGYDQPSLDTVVLAAPTLSLARYYQEVGRGIRPYAGKQLWVVDIVGNWRKFGDVLNIRLGTDAKGRLQVYGDNGQLTGVYLNSFTRR